MRARKRSTNERINALNEELNRLHFRGVIGDSAHEYLKNLISLYSYKTTFDRPTKIPKIPHCTSSKLLEAAARLFNNLQPCYNRDSTKAELNNEFLEQFGKLLATSIESINEQKLSDFNNQQQAKNQFRKFLNRFRKQVKQDVSSKYSYNNDIDLQKLEMVKGKLGAYFDLFLSKIRLESPNPSFIIREMSINRILRERSYSPLLLKTSIISPPYVSIRDIEQTKKEELYIVVGLDQTQSMMDVEKLRVLQMIVDFIESKVAPLEIKKKFEGYFYGQAMTDSYISIQELLQNIEFYRGPTYTLDYITRLADTFKGYGNVTAHILAITDDQDTITRSEEREFIRAVEQLKSEGINVVPHIIQLDDGSTEQSLRGPAEGLGGTYITIPIGI